MTITYTDRRGRQTLAFVAPHQPTDLDALIRNRDNYLLDNDKTGWKHTHDWCPASKRSGHRTITGFKCNCGQVRYVDLV